MKEKIKKIAFEYGADVCGVGNIDRFGEAPKGFSPLDLWNGCKSVISVGFAIPKGLLEVEPRLIYGHFNYDTCSTLDDLVLRVAKRIEKEFKCIAIPVPSDAPNEYWDSEKMEAKGLISMKHTAHLCGLGSIGKSTLLINPEYGNLLTIGAILTDLPMESDPMQENLCIPGCSKCMDSCPAGAIQEGRVNQKLCRNNTYGKTARGFSTVDCNRCRTVCPMRFGKFE